MDLYCQLVTESSDINWVIIQVELEYVFITVVFVISCVESGDSTDCIISSVTNTTLSLSLTYRQQINSTTFLYDTETGWSA